MRTQNARILDFMATGRPITPMVALRRFNSLRLGARIYDLKRQGHNITSRMVRRGDTKVAEYRLCGCR